MAIAAHPEIDRTSRPTAVMIFDEDAPGACLCPEFAAIHGRRELHTSGQPGCVEENAHRTA